MKPERIQSDVLDPFLGGGPDAPYEVELHLLYDTPENARRGLEEALGELPPGGAWPPIRFEPGDACYASRVVVGVELGGGSDGDPPPPGARVAEASLGEATPGAVGPPGRDELG